MAYEDLSAKDMVVVDVDGHIVDGSLNLSSDTKTHIEFFKAFGEIGAIPCTRNLTYRTFQNRSLNSLFVSRVLCRSHGPFAVSYTHLDVYKRQGYMQTGFSL